MKDIGHGWAGREDFGLGLGSSALVFEYLGVVFKKYNPLFNTPEQGILFFSYDNRKIEESGVVFS
jgi:hypothetical protein